jgi:hypothetical protein
VGLYLNNNSSEKIVLANGGGYVGIRDNNPTYLLELPSTHGARARVWVTYSSRRLKKNIQPISNALDKVLRLRGVYFDWKEDGKHDIGLVAEEVGEVIPEAVDYEENGKDARALAYSRLVAVLIEAVKEQQKQIETMRTEINALKSGR